MHRCQMPGLMENIKFKDEPLASIVKRLENYYNVNIHLDDKRLEKSDIRVHFRWIRISWMCSELLIMKSNSLLNE